MFRGQFILLLFKEHCSLFSWKLVLTCSLNHHTMRVTEDEMDGITDTMDMSLSKLLLKSLRW